MIIVVLVQIDKTGIMLHNNMEGEVMVVELLLIYLFNGTRPRDVIVLSNTLTCIAGQVLWHWTCRP